MPLQLVWHRDVHAPISSGWVSTAVNDVRQYCNGWKSGVKNCTWGDIQCQNITLSVMSWKKRGPDLLVHRDLPHTGISRGELTKSQVIYLKLKNEINSKYNIIQHFVLDENQVGGCNSCFLIYHRAFWKLFQYSSFRQQLTQSCHRWGKKRMNILLMFSYLCVTEFLKFNVYGNVIKKKKRKDDDVSFVMFLLFQTWKKKCCNYICM